MLYFVLFLGLLVFFHEFGHFIVARLVGVRVIRLSIGFGPKLVGFRRGGTEYWVSALPLGGYVKLAGDDPEAARLARENRPDGEVLVEKPESEKEEGRTYLAREGFFTTDLWRRVLIVLAGPVFSLAMPVFLFFPMFLSRSELPPAVVGAVARDGPAWNAGIRPGDRVVEVEGSEVRYFFQLQDAVESSPGRPMAMTIERDGARKSITVTPSSVPDPMMRDLGFSSESGRIEVTLESSRPVALVEPGGAFERAGAGEFLSLVGRLRFLDDPVGRRVVAVLAVDGLEPSSFEEVERQVAAARERPVRIRFAATTDVPDELGPIAEVSVGPLREDEPIGLSDGSPVVVHVDPDSPAARAGLRPGDRVTAVDGKPFGGWLFMMQDLERSPDDDHVFSVARNGERVEVRLSLRNPAWAPGAAVPKYAFGAVNRRAVVEPDPIPNEERLSYALGRTIRQTRQVFVVTVAAIGGLFSGRVSVREMGGPIMIYQIASTTGKRGWNDFFNAMAWLSMSIGVLNLLPVPVLDGGNLVMFAIEGIRRRPVGRKGWQVARYFGVAFLMLLMVLVFTNDFGRLGAMMGM